MPVAHSHLATLPVGSPGQQTKSPKPPAVEIKRTFVPNRDAMLQALRVVLGMPRLPIVLKDEQLAITSE